MPLIVHREMGNSLGAEQHFYQALGGGRVVLQKINQFVDTIRLPFFGVVLSTNRMITGILSLGSETAMASNSDDPISFALLWEIATGKNIHPKINIQNFFYMICFHWLLKNEILGFVWVCLAMKEKKSVVQEYYLSFFMF